MDGTDKDLGWEEKWTGMIWRGVDVVLPVVSGGLKGSRQNLVGSREF